MKQQHTPGPWQEFQDADSHDVIARDGSHIARIEPRNGLSPASEQIANARLIAASPTLAEFAAFVRDACARLNDARAVSSGNVAMLAEELNDMAEQAYTALALVDGPRRDADNEACPKCGDTENQFHYPDKTECNHCGLEREAPATEPRDHAEYCNCADCVAARGWLAANPFKGDGE